MQLIFRDLGLKNAYTRISLLKNANVIVSFANVLFQSGSPGYLQIGLIF